MESSMIKYSPSTGNFYPADINYSSYPADIIEVPLADAAAALSRAADERIEVQAGRLVMVKNTVPTDAARDRVEQIIKSERDRRVGAGVAVGNKWFHTDTFSRAQQLGLSALGKAIPANTQWKSMDGSCVLMTATLANQILAAAVQQDIAIFAAADRHIALMRTSPDPLKYDYSQGWPPSFRD